MADSKTYAITPGTVVRFGPNKEFVAGPGDEEKLLKHLTPEQVAALRREQRAESASERRLEAAVEAAAEADVTDAVVATEGEVADEAAPSKSRRGR